MLGGDNGAAEPTGRPAPRGSVVVVDVGVGEVLDGNTREADKVSKARSVVTTAPWGVGLRCCMMKMVMCW